MKRLLAAVALILLLPVVGNALEKKKSTPIQSIVTFKGVKFGSSIDDFLKAFPASNCGDKSIIMVLCHGGSIDYLSQNNAMYRATFFGSSYSEGFHRPSSVDVATHSDDIDKKISEISTIISKSFGLPERITKQGFTPSDLDTVDQYERDVFLWNGQEGKIILSACYKKHDRYKDGNILFFPREMMQECTGSFVYVKLTSNHQFFNDTSPSSDF